MSSRPLAYREQTEPGHPLICKKEQHLNDASTQNSWLTWRIEARTTSWFGEKGGIYAN